MVLHYYNLLLYTCPGENLVVGIFLLFCRTVGVYSRFKVSIKGYEKK